MIAIRSLYLALALVKVPVWATVVRMPVGWLEPVEPMVVI